MKRHGGANLTIGYEIYQVLGVQSYGPYHISFCHKIHKVGSIRHFLQLLMKIN